MEYSKKIYLKRGKEDSLLRFHPWVFSGAIARTSDDIEEGDVVSVYTSTDKLIGHGHYQIGSIMVRMLTFDPTEKVDTEEFFRGRLQQAFKVRQACHLISPEGDDKQNNSYRLVHGEGDFLSGLVIDVYGETAVLQAHSPGMHFFRNTIAKALVSIPQIGIRNVYYKSETTLPYKAHLDAQNDYIIGEYTTNIATENGLKFHVDWLKGQKTGFFIDQRDNRALLERYSHGRNVLNMFCYTGGFSFYAMRGGAKTVHSVDSSAKAIELTRANVALNFPDDDRHEAFAEDAFKYLDEMPDGSSYDSLSEGADVKEQGYDLIVLDPPAFAKHRSALRNALQGYRRLNAKAFAKIRRGGILFTFSCSQAVNREQFRLAVFSAAAQSGRRVRILHQLTQPCDHPINIYHPEGEYLKGLVLYVE